MTTRLYTDLAGWWPLLSTPADYAEEAGFYRKALVEVCAPRTLLELGSGGGNNASHLKAHFELTLVDVSPEMLAVSRKLNPECEHLQGDMRDVRLERQFDAVFVHDAVMYMTSERDLGRAIETAFVHCRPGGAALLVPDCFRETFVASSNVGGHDGEDRALRYLEWDYDPDPDDDTFVTDFVYMLRTREGSLQVVEDHHVHGIFERERWLRLCRDAGFEPEIQKVVHSDTDPAEAEMILCRRPRDT